MKDDIKFGTDGWRAIIDKDFIPENIKRVTQAFADLYPTLKNTGKGVAIGYDRRRNSKETAEMIANVLVANNIPVMLSEGFCPTPEVSWMVKNHKLTAGIMVTASHNPPEWNGIKFKESSGGASSSDYVTKIEKQITLNDESKREIKESKGSLDGKIKYYNPYGEYAESIKKLVDIDVIKTLKKHVLIDPLYGSGCGFYPLMIDDMAEEIHNTADTNFGGLHPEPIPPYVNELMEKIKKGDYLCGLVTDGDADRAGAVDENGKYVTTHEIYSLLIKHIVENKGWKGTIIKSISTTQMLNRLGKKYNLEVKTVPVGFKYISPAMNEPGVLIGGEESGGFGLPRHIPERDGILSGLLLLELMATNKKPLSQLVAELQKDVGPCYYRRLDLKLSQDDMKKATEHFKTLSIKEFDGKKVVEHNTMDGHHFLFEDDSWMLFRKSGTEPLVRIYAEGPTPDKIEKMIAKGKEMLGL
ncbi:MAG: phosphoglucomutase/phosphomannomutase family protein [Pseudomonadota bacterium]